MTSEINIWKIMADMQAAKLAARKRLDDNRISVKVKQGKALVLLVTYVGKTSIEDPVSDFMPLADCIKYLGEMSRGCYE